MVAAARERACRPVRICRVTCRVEAEVRDNSFLLGGRVCVVQGPSGTSRTTCGWAASPGPDSGGAGGRPAVVSARRRDRFPPQEPRRTRHLPRGLAPEPGGALPPMGLAAGGGKWSPPAGLVSAAPVPSPSGQAAGISDTARPSKGRGKESGGSPLKCNGPPYPMSSGVPQRGVRPL